MTHTEKEIELYNQYWKEYLNLYNSLTPNQVTNFMAYYYNDKNNYANHCKIYKCIACLEEHALLLNEFKKRYV